MSVIYSAAIPENIKASYGEYDNVDFIMSFSNQVLVCPSIRLECDLEVTQNGLPLNDTANTYKNILMDKLVGGHAFIESVQTEVQGQVIENLNEYARYVKMVSAATLSNDSMYSSAQVCELKGATDHEIQMMLKGEVVATQPAVPLRNNPDFSIKPKMLLNNGRGMLPYSRTGSVRISFNLARINSALYGLDVSADTKYVLKNMRLTYQTYPDVGQGQAMIPFAYKLAIKQSIQSQFANISTKVPATVNSVSCSLQYQDEENTPLNNNQQLQKIPNVEQVQFLFNDSSNKYITFSLKNNEEIVSRFIESLQDTGANSMSVNKLNNNNGYGMGLRFGGDFIDLRNQKFNIQVNSALSSNTPMILYMYFHSQVSL